MVPAKLFSQTDQWIKSAETEDGAKYFINMSKIMWDEGTAQAWIKYCPGEEDKKQTISSRVEILGAEEIRKWINYEYNLNLEEFDCKTKRVRTVKTYYYDRNGNCIDEYAPQEIEWSIIVPTSVYESVLKRICSSKK